MALAACSLLYGVDEMVVMHTFSLSLFIPKGKASVLGVWTVLGRKGESLPVCPTVSIFYQMREQGGRGRRILVQCLCWDWHLQLLNPLCLEIPGGSRRVSARR